MNVIYILLLLLLTFSMFSIQNKGIATVISYTTAPKWDLELL